MHARESSFTVTGFSAFNLSCHLLLSLNLQYNFKKQNETAVREEMVEMANLLDGVRI